MAVNHQLTTTRTIGQGVGMDSAGVTQMCRCSEKVQEIGQGVGFERTRRITGYLSTIPRFCDSKLAELKDRVLHVGKPAVMRGIWAKTEEAA